MLLNTDQIIFWQWGILHLNATIINTWLLMTILISGSYLLMRMLNTGDAPSKWQLIIEIIISFLEKQIKDISQQNSNQYLAFICSLFLFIAAANLFDVIPFLYSPTSSLSTTTALALCVFFAVPAFSISKIGLIEYIKNYFRPSIFMLPFTIIGEISRTLALAIRLYGNVMSGTVIVAILLSLTPFLFPVLMNLIGLLTGMIQAYIFSILAVVYIASASKINN